MSSRDSHSSRSAWIAVIIGSFVVVSILARDNGQPSHPKPDRAARADAAHKLSALPLYFERNQGQSDPRVRYLSRRGDYTIFLTDDAAVFSMVGLANHSAGNRLASSALKIRLVGANEHPRIEAHDQLRGHVNYLIGKDPSKWHRDVPIFDSVEYRGVYRGVDLSYYGSNGEIEYDMTAAPGTDLDQIKFAIEGADASLDSAGNVALATAAGSLTLRKPTIYQEDADGDRNEVAGEFRLGAKTTSADGVATREVTLALGAYDKSRAVVIDPQLVYSSLLGGTGTSHGPNEAYNNFNVFPDLIGGVVLADASLGVATDSSGNAYIAGTSYSNNFPATTGAFQTTLKGGNTPPAQNPNAIIAKFDPNLSGNNSLVYATYLGGSGDTVSGVAGNGDLANGIAVDPASDAYVVGYTFSTDFPVPNCGSWGSTKNGSTTMPVDNGFVSVLNPAGNGLIYSCFINGSAGAAATRVALNPTCTNSSNCDVYIGGATATLNNMGTDFPATSNAFQKTNPDTNRNAAAFFLVVNAGGGSPLYGSFYGGSGIGPGITDPNQFGGEGALGITVDSSGNGYMTGYTFSTDLPLSPTSAPSPAQVQNNAKGVGLVNAFVAEFNPNASGRSSLPYSTYFGGSGVPFSMGPPLLLAQGDVGTGIALDSSGHIFIIGSAYSTNLTTTSNAYQPMNNGAQRGANNAFITEFDTTQSGASQVVYSTYFGGSGQQQSVLNSLGEFPSGLALDSSGRVFFAGTTASINLPKSPNACQQFIQGKQPFSPFAAILAPPPLQTGNAQLEFSTYLGGTSIKGDVASDVKTFNGLIYVTGYANSNDFPSTDNAFQRPNNASANGFTNAFISMIDPTSSVCPTPTASATATPTPSATPTVLPGPTGFIAPRNVKLTGAPGSTVNATFQVVNHTGVPETINSITMSLANPSIFSSMTMTTGAQSVTVTAPGISSVFNFNPPVPVANNAMLNYTLALTLAGNGASNGPFGRVAYASIVPASKSRAGRGVLPLLAGLMLLGLGLTVWPENKRAKIAIAALVVVMMAATLGGCSGGGGGGGGGSSGTSSGVFVETAVATGNGGALDNVPLKIASVTRQ
jgi:hypothetical protein